MKTPTSECHTEPHTIVDDRLSDVNETHNYIDATKRNFTFFNHHFDLLSQKTRKEKRLRLTKNKIVTKITIIRCEWRSILFFCFFLL